MEHGVIVAVVAVVEAVPVEDFLEVGEVVIGAGVVAQGGHSLEVGVVSFEVVVPEGILGAEEPEVVEVVFVDHSTLTFVNLQYYCEHTNKPVLFGGASLRASGSLFLGPGELFWIASRNRAEFDKNCLYAVLQLMDFGEYEIYLCFIVIPVTGTLATEISCERILYYISMA